MSKEEYYGKDCPKGMVQVEFVGVSPRLKHGAYGYKPSKSAFLEIYVDGQRYRIDVGNITRMDGSKVRGIHVSGPINMIVDKHSLNAVDIFTGEDAR